MLLSSAMIWQTGFSRPMFFSFLFVTNMYLQVRVADASSLPPLLRPLQEKSEKEIFSPCDSTTNIHLSLPSVKPLSGCNVSANRTVSANHTVSAVSNRQSFSEDLNPVKSKSSFSPIKLAMEALPASTTPGLLQVYPYMTSTPSLSSVASVLQMNNQTSTASERLPSSVPDPATTTRHITQDFASSQQVSSISTSNPVQVIDLTKTWPACFQTSLSSLTKPTTAQAVSLQAASHQLICPTVPDLISANNLSGKRSSDMQVDAILSRNGSRSLSKGNVLSLL